MNNVITMKNKSLEDELSDYVRDEMDDGATFEDILEDFDITPAQAFVVLFNAGLVDEEVLAANLREV
jgi:hypothetical protein